MAKKTKDELEVEVAALRHELAVERGEFDEWQEPIKQWLKANWKETGDQRHSTKAILTGAVGLQEKLFDRRAFKRLLKIMVRLGWEPSILEVKGIRHRGYRKSSY